MAVDEQTPRMKAGPGGVYRDKPCTLQLEDLHLVSAVCRQWRDVIQTLLEYWTRVIVFIDTDEHLEEMKKALERSKDLPLDVRVTRTNWDDEDVDKRAFLIAQENSLHQGPHTQFYLRLVDPETVREGRYKYRVDNLTIIGQDEEWVQEFNIITYGTSLCYYHSGGTSIAFQSIPVAHHLRLQSIPDYCGYAFDRAISRHYGNRLDFIECEGLTNRPLDLIATKCNLLRRLYIINCPNVTVLGFKNMLMRQNDLTDGKVHVVGDADTSDEFRSVVELTV
ncbi:hypothetical protein NLJ89_g7745 [Agrocybe chaxingu]|uniref:Uncharacterized protein n=1 Tax=Agrocybe chaxingu TaxID=84603 RepID=A0A9W8K3T6_9AGAR|nr:hypothetical protein NLJ89_g7745 [Agrocybe chaxingu]